MRFEVAEDAAALRAASDAILRGTVTGAVIRAGWPGGDRRTVVAAWRRLADAGATGALVGQSDGGLGLDLTAVTPLLEAVGYSGLPVPAAETIAVAAPLLAGHDALADVVAGSALVTTAFDTEQLVPHGQDADFVLLRSGHELRLHTCAELTLEPVSSIDGSRGLARLIGPADGGSVLTTDPREVEAAWLRGVLATSAVLLGLATRMLDMTVTYVKARHQFGAPIGSFQAIKHTLADALVGIEFARPAVAAAGWAQAHSVPDAPAQTSLAKVLATEAATGVARAAIQCHGAIGYTTEYDLHLFAKRVWALAPSWGSPAWHRAALARVLGIEKE